MKKLLTLAALAAVALTSCSNDEDLHAGDSAEIRLGAGMVSTKAPVNSLSDLSGVGGKVGIYAISTPWTSTPLMRNVQTVAIDPTSGAISWATVYNYPTDGSSLTFYGYYPYAAEATEGRNFVTASDGTAAPRLNFTIDGTQDLMYATPVTGSMSQAPGTLQFNHALTQLHFQALLGTADAATQVKSIRIKDANSRGVMNIADGTLTGWQTPAALAVLENGTFTVPGTAAAIDGATPVMVQPGLSEMLIDVETTLNGSATMFKNIRIKPEGDLTFREGISYAITLTFNEAVAQQPIEIKADVTPWVTSGRGNGTVQ